MRLFIAVMVLSLAVTGAAAEGDRAAGDLEIARKGQALIWCANLLHGGSTQTNPRLTRWSQVTHYYFENCLHYTPAFSDEVLGALDLRQITAISDGKPRPNTYLGESLAAARALSAASRAQAPRKSGAPSWLKRVLGK